VANTLLDLADEKGMSLTHMAVHKVAYYAHGWFLAQHGRPLVRQEFEAWKDGPVLRPVWETLKVSGSAAVKTRATKFDPVRRTTEIVASAMEPMDREFLANVLAAYGFLHAYELSAMTHARGSPWDLVWNAPTKRVTLGMKITHASIRAHFERVSAQGVRAS
jgi:uncharacterized phage-associated protein